MSISPHEEKMLNLQHQMRQNQSDLQSYLAGLDDWTSEIKEKEKNLMSKKQNDNKNADLPPVRNTIEKKKLKKKKKDMKLDPNKPKRISGYDFRAWDKFDVDKALEDIDESHKKAETSSSEYETDEEWEMERKKHLAEQEKEKGNMFLKNADLDRAIDAYSKGIEYDSTNSLLHANRALALIKQQKFAAAELDCTTSIALDPLYVKAYLRRATARANLSKVEEALDDYRRVIDLEPSNKQAHAEIERLEKELKREKEGPVQSSFIEGQRGIVKPVYKSVDDRSKAPLRRIEIEEIGVEPVKRPQQPFAKQSEVAQNIAAKEGQMFDTLFKSSSTTITTTKGTSNVSQDQNRPANDNKTSSTETSSELKSKASNSKNDTDSRVEEISSPLESATTGVPPNKNFSSTRTDSESQRQSKVSQSHSAKPSAISNCDKGDELNFQVPQSSFQFQADFKILKNKPDSFSTYFQAIPPSDYPKLFGQCLDADILNTVLKSLSSGHARNLYGILQHLTLVKRFTMTTMFLSSRDKQVVDTLLGKISESGEHTEVEIADLRKKYQL